MKFQKFINQLSGEGVIQTRADGSKWLVSCTSLMKIPDEMCGVVAESIAEMPKNIEAILNKEWSGAIAHLQKAIMPFGDSAIKDCIRVYVGEENPSIKLPITNDDYALIEVRKDQVEILADYDAENDTYIPRALLVKRPYLNDDAELLGVIFPIPDAVGNI